MMGRRARWSTALVLCALGLALAPRPEPVARAERPGALAGPEAAFEEVRSVRSAMRGAPPGERELLRERAIELYEELFRRESLPARARAEAAFRAGELARAGGDTDRARRAFGVALGLSASEFACRARLELGHIARRAGENARAARHYESLLLGPCDDPYLRDQTLFWLARVRAASGRIEAAADILRGLVGTGNAGAVRARAERELAEMGARSGRGTR